ncbi:MAG: hypothetical protein B9S38_02820 [Verrucomicrobiia bacterium Tous-C4TDCM]|nr:MAG: hypothetical protein B9S38_02820 [Verrucomicrobiae bacterium Tous-C4TDCM]
MKQRFGAWIDLLTRPPRPGFQGGSSRVSRPAATHHGELAETAEQGDGKYHMPEFHCLVGWERFGVKRAGITGG